MIIAPYNIISSVNQAYFFVHALNFSMQNIPITIENIIAVRKFPTADKINPNNEQNRYKKHAIAHPMGMKSNSNFPNVV